MNEDLRGDSLDRLMLPVPGQQLVDALCQMIPEPSEHVGELGLRIDIVEFGSLDQDADRRGAPATSVAEAELGENINLHLTRFQMLAPR